MEPLKTKYIVTYSSFFPPEHEFFDTLEEVKQDIIDSDFTQEEIAKIRVFEIKLEIEAKSLLEKESGLKVMVPEGVNFKNCVCCGQPTLSSEIHDICSNCWWQDDPAAWNNIDDENNANGISLREARLNYEKYGDCDGIVEKEYYELASESMKGSDNATLNSLSDDLKSFEKSFKERLNERFEDVKKKVESVENDVKKRLRAGRKGGEVISEEEVERKYGYTKEHFALDLLYFDTSLTKEEKLELFSQLSDSTIEKIPDKDLEVFGIEREELKKLLVSFKLIKANEDLASIKEDEDVSEEFKLKVEELKKQLEPPDKENKTLYRVIQEIVEDDNIQSVNDFYNKRRFERQQERNESKEKSAEFKRKLEDIIGDMED
jgi:hypothetical protein